MHAQSILQGQQMLQQGQQNSMNKTCRTPQQGQQVLQQALARLDARSWMRAFNSQQASDGPTVVPGLPLSAFLPATTEALSRLLNKRMVALINPYNLPPVPGAVRGSQLRALGNRLMVSVCSSLWGWSRLRKGVHSAAVIPGTAWRAKVPHEIYSILQPEKVEH